MKKSLMFVLATFALLAGSVSSFGQMSGWTSPCSAGATIDETSTGLYQVNNASLFFRAGRTGTVIARYDVVNTAVPSVAVTPWSTLELGFFDTTGGNVTATLFQVEPCTGRITTICKATSFAASTAQCVKCTFAPGMVNYLNFLYYVQVTVTRTSTNINPQANTLRVF